MTNEDRETARGILDLARSTVDFYNEYPDKAETEKGKDNLEKQLKYLSMTKRREPILREGGELYKECEAILSDLRGYLGESQ